MHDVGTSSHLVALEDAWPSERLGPTFLTTYTLNAPFFEAILLPLLVHRRASPIVVFADRRVGYGPAVEAIASLASAGRDYYLVSVDWEPGVFHPKVHLFEAAATALVGSGNLTPSGCGGNLEAFDRVDGAVDGAALAEVRRFFRALIEDRRVALSPEEREYLSAKLPPQDAAHGDAVFLHTLAADPLLPRVEELDLGGAGDEGLLAAPFQDYDHTTVRVIARALRLREPRVAANPRRPPPVPGGFVTGSLADPEGRVLHAKLVYRRGPQSALLCLGSANLTGAAWGGRNAEAVVLRQALDPAQFAGFLAEAEFVAGEWDAPVEIKDREPPALPQLPQPAVTLQRDAIFVEVVASGVPLSFVLDDGHTQVPLQMEPCGASTWCASLDEIPRGCSRIVVHAAGYRSSSGIVFHVGDLRRSAWQSRLRRVRESNSVVDDPLRHEILAQIGELLARLHGRRTSSAEQADSPGQRQAGRKSEPEADETFELVDDLEEVLRRGSRDVRAQIHELTKLIDAALSPDAPAAALADPAGPRRWTAGDLVDVTEDDAEDDERTVSDLPSAGVEGVVDAISETLVPAVLRIATSMSTKVAELATSSTEDALLLQETIVYLLLSAARRSPTSRNQIAARLVEWLQLGWAVEEWPSPCHGWVVKAARQRRLTVVPDFLRSLDALFEWLHWVDPEIDEKGDGHRALDRGRLVLLGLREVASHLRQDGGGDLGDSRIEGSAFARTLGRLDEHRSLAERARVLLEPLWRIEFAGRAVERARARHCTLAGQLQVAEAKMRRLSHRASGYKQAAEDAVRLTTLLAESDGKLSSRRERLNSKIDAALALRDAGLAELVERWERARWKDANSDRWHKLARPRGSTCSSCNMQFNATFASQIANPIHVAPCPNCGVLLAAGVPEGST